MEFIDLGIYLKKSKTLIICDTHFGIEESLNKKGIMIPRLHFKEQMNRMKQIISKVDFETIIINGDVKEEFGKISETEWRNTLQFLDLFKGKRIIIITGNHDKQIIPVAKKRDIEVFDHFVIGDVLLCHGDKIIDAECETIIIGHEHPAVGIEENNRYEIFKCYLVGKYLDKKLIVQPSFKLMTEGSDILRKKLFSPYLEDISDFIVYVVSDDILEFGKVKDLYSSFT